MSTQRSNISVDDVAVLQEEIERGEKSIPASHNHLDVHGILYPTRTLWACVALGCENPSEYVEAFLPLRRITVVKVSGRTGPFSPPTYKFYAPTAVKTWAYENFDRHAGKPVRKGGRKLYYYGTRSAGYWRRFSRWREESGPFVRIAENEVDRLYDWGFGHITGVGITGLSVIREPEEKRRWLLELDGDRWAATDWAPGEGLPEAVESSVESAKKAMCETIAGRSLTDEEYENLGE